MCVGTGTNPEYLAYHVTSQMYVSYGDFLMVTVTMGKISYDPFQKFKEYCNFTEEL